MATKVQAPQLTPNNCIYLYQLLSRELGCGKQTFMPAVEEALARDRMTSDDLGFESTRALLEALEEFVKLTVFKGGRIYATVMAQPVWDEALAALESGKAKDAGGPSNKPWKRKKADKALKPVRPKRVKRPEPAPEPEPIAKTEAVESPSLPGAAAQTRAEETEAASENTNADAANVLEVGALAVEGAEVSEPIETAGAHEEAHRTENEDTCECIEEDPRPSPAISLTVTYDPYRGIDREMKLESHPAAANAQKTPRKPACALSEAPAGTMDPAGEPKTPAGAQPIHPVRTVEPAQAVTPAPQGAATPQVPAPRTPDSKPQATAPEIIASYPVDFSTEVYLASDRIAELCELLPYGTDVFTLLAEDYDRARSLGLLGGSRARATFPLRIQHADSTEPIRIDLKKRSGTALQWELSTVE